MMTRSIRALMRKRQRGRSCPMMESIDAVYVEALIPIPPPTAYHRREPVRHVLDSADAPGTSPTSIAERRRIAAGSKGVPRLIP